MAKLQIILFVALVCIACGSAKPTRKDEHSRRTAEHDRSSAVRRQADINLSTEVAKAFRSRQRMEMLMKLINPHELGKQNISYKIHPHGNDTRYDKETSNILMRQLNGEPGDVNLRVRVVNHRPVTAPQNVQDFARQADELRQQVALATTCLELQKTLLKIPSLRVKVTCASNTAQRSAPLAGSYPTPAGMMAYRYAPAGKIYSNGHSRENVMTLSRRHASQRLRIKTRQP